MLKLNDAGPAVADLQRHLLAFDYDLGKSGADGVFGSLTAAAVRLFQRSQGLAADGLVGPATQQALAALPAGARPPLVAPQGLAEIRAQFGDLQLVMGPNPAAACYLKILGDWEARHLIHVPLPGLTALHSIYCHRKIAPLLQAVFAEIVAAGLGAALKSYDGCFCPRYKARSVRSLLSLHSWAIAVDLNAATNRQGTAGAMPAGIISCFRRQGFKWGGDWTGRYRDPMHFQYAGGY